MVKHESSLSEALENNFFFFQKEKAKKIDADSPEGKKSASNSSSSCPKQNKSQRVPDDMQADRPAVEKKLAKSLASQQVTLEFLIPI